MTEPIAVTVLTGFLGSGKTTTLNHLLTQNHGQRFAVIVNEFGEIGIDEDLILHVDDDVLEINNGCLCCTTRGDLDRVLMKILDRRDDFSRVIIETTGLADPAPIASTLMAQQGHRYFYELDGVVTLVDAHHLLDQLGRSPEVPRQIGFADVLVLNKLDLVDDPEKLAEIDRRLKILNPGARIVRTEHGNLDPQILMDIGGFDPRRLEANDPIFGPDDDHGHSHEHGHDHDHGHEHSHGHEHQGHAHKDHDHKDHGHQTHGHEQTHGHASEHSHDHEHGPLGRHEQGVYSISVTEDRPLDGSLVDAWLRVVVQMHGDNLYRMKGILNVAGLDRRCVFHGGQQLVGAEIDRLWKEDESRVSRAVFIGRDLDGSMIREGFANCVAQSP